jgi:hypothetical protein
VPLVHEGEEFVATQQGGFVGMIGGHRKHKPRDPAVASQTGIYDVFDHRARRDGSNGHGRQTETAVVDPYGPTVSKFAKRHSRATGVPELIGNYSPLPRILRVRFCIIPGLMSVPSV